jgi:uncharacterized protein (TIGR02145 family)
MKTYEEYIEEKLNIKPMSKARLANMRLIHNGNGWKEKLQTGDAVLVQFSKDESTLCYFMRYETYIRYYENILNLYDIEHSLASKSGFFLIPPVNVNYFTYIGLGYFKDNCMEGVANPNLKIKGIYRYNLTSTPSKEFLTNTRIDRSKAVCLYEEEGLNEKLNIQPMSKERLGKYKHSKINTQFNPLLGNIVKIGNMWWTAENLVIEPNSDFKAGEDYYEIQTTKNGHPFIEIYYKFDTAKAIIPNGWHLPTKEDVIKLIAICGDDISAYTSKECGGYDTYGLNETYDGYYYCGFKYRESDSIFTFWMDCEPWGDGEYRKAYSLVGNKSDNSVIRSWITTSVHALPVRLVKD